MIVALTFFFVFFFEIFSDDIRLKMFELFTSKPTKELQKTRRYGRRNVCIQFFKMVHQYNIIQMSQHQKRCPIIVTQTTSMVWDVVLKCSFLLDEEEKHLSTPTSPESDTSATNETTSLILEIQKDLRKPLEDMKISGLQLVTNPVILGSEMNVKDGIKILVDKHIRCAPVRDDSHVQTPTAQSPSNKFMGVLDVRDSLKYAVEKYRQDHSALPNNDNIKNADEQLSFDIASLPPEIMTNKVSYLGMFFFFFFFF
ncbi:hypothetical protein RFI_03364 [Reticulomyxa filosa]|uniref:CBS domain-containing protein n=1 Tax=Reticulomyxa filosa TaxID=46433 RepID=X6P6M5_RETFI|nr:hypothetical protein RFI_03364 [Reticulomyxa filosa]|eukprot:ETO33739.1 hypothetical protein RFI_03364 [Reticulomyxa filosa]